MSYNLKKITDLSLKQLNIVMEDFCHKAELKQSTANLLVDYLGLDGVGKDDHRAIIEKLTEYRYLHTEYHMFYLTETFYPFLDEVNAEIHDRYHKKFLEEQKSKTSSNTDNKKARDNSVLTLVSDPGILIIGKDNIKIDSTTNAFKVLDFIFVKNKKDYLREFKYSELAKSPAFNDSSYPQNKKSWETYHSACRYANQKIYNETSIKKFLLFGSKNTAKFSINPKVLETLGISDTKLG